MMMIPPPSQQAVKVIVVMVRRVGQLMCRLHRREGGCQCKVTLGRLLLLLQEPVDSNIHLRPCGRPWKQSHRPAILPLCLSASLTPSSDSPSVNTTVAN
ncbi:hypothetical protein E2C01_000325 [Portunus trituberculatus]|uniref:Uncharacterized protein n=1 Tax=Portunus trituberculatus TaxID=210409 RepID=A0A5B7CED2_PORTR|nr:hypothetical protein [Portunus trituberculatus]